MGAVVVALLAHLLIVERIVVFPHGDAILLAACSERLTGHFECAIVVGRVNSGKSIVIHAALHDVDVGSPVMAHDGQVCDK